MPATVVRFLLVPTYSPLCNGWSRVLSLTTLYSSTSALPLKTQDQIIADLVCSSGHGGQTQDLDGDEDDGYDEVIYPLDFKTAGHITDDDSE